MCIESFLFMQGTVRARIDKIVLDDFRSVGDVHWNNQLFGHDGIVAVSTIT